MVGDNLRQRRPCALALRRRAGRDRDLAVRHAADGDAFERAQARAFDIVADADAEIAPRAARLGLPLAEVAIARGFEGLAVAQREVAAHIDQWLAVAEREPRLIRHLLRLDDVAGP